MYSFFTFGLLSLVAVFIFGGCIMLGISCIVPVYNVEEYLPRCIDSILAQTFGDFELILVDDGSSDKCPKICDEYSANDLRIKVIHKVNGGLSDARNVGMDASSGDYIFFIDSDDWLYDENVFQLLFDKAVESNADIVVGKIVVSKTMTSPENVSNLESYFHTALCYSACNKLFRASILVGKKFVVGQKNEDMPFVSDLLFNKNVSFIDQNTYVYFQRDGSITHTLDEKSFCIVQRGIDVINNLKLSQKNNELLSEIVKENIFSFSIFTQTIRIFNNSKGAKRKDYFYKFFDILDSQNLTLDFYYYASKGIMKLHKKNLKLIYKLLFLMYVKILNHLFSNKHKKEVCVRNINIQTRGGV